jgi:hypothetical protein
MISMSALHPGLATPSIFPHTLQKLHSAHSTSEPTLLAKVGRLLPTVDLVLRRLSTPTLQLSLALIVIDLLLGQSTTMEMSCTWPIGYRRTQRSTRTLEDSCAAAEAQRERCCESGSPCCSTSCRSIVCLRRAGESYRNDAGLCLSRYS